MNRSITSSPSRILLLAAILALVACGPAEKQAAHSAENGEEVEESICGDPSDIQVDLSPVEGCTVFRGMIGVSDHPGDGFLTPLSALRVIEGHFKLFRNRRMQSLEGLENLERVGGDVGLRILDELNDLQELAQLSEVGGMLHIASDASLTTLTRLESLRKVRGDLIIVNNGVLEDLEGLSGLEEVHGDVRITLNPLLSDEEKRAFVDRVEIGGTVNLGE